MTFVNTRRKRRRERGDDPEMVDEFTVKVKVKKAKKKAKKVKNVDQNKR